MCPVEIFDWTVFSTKIYEYFHRPRAARKTFWHFGAKTSESLSNLQFRSTKIFCWTFDFWRKNFHNCLEYWSKKFQVFVKKCWVGEKFMSKVIFFVGKNSCLPTEFEGESFWCSVRTFGRFVKTAALCVRMRFLSELFFLWIFWVFSLFSDCGKIICNIGAKSLEKLSKVHSTWTTSLFEESLYFEENTYFHSFFDIWWKTLHTSVGKRFPRFEKLLSALVQGIVLHNIIIFTRKFTPTNGFWGKISVSKNLQNFQLFLDFEENISDFWRK